MRIKHSIIGVIIFIVVTVIVFFLVKNMFSFDGLSAIIAIITGFGAEIFYRKKFI